MPGDWILAIAIARAVERLTGRCPGSACVTQRRNGDVEMKTGSAFCASGCRTKGRHTLGAGHALLLAVGRAEHWRFRGRTLTPFGFSVALDVWCHGRLSRVGILMP
jgi:hypothetical protein